MLTAAPAAPETLRIATYHTDLGRQGPGLLLRDIRAGKDRQVSSLVAVIAGLEADVILLTGIDLDPGGATLAALRGRLQAAGIDYPHAYAPLTNRGLRSGRDLDGDGKVGGPGDAQGYGAFPGSGAMAILSRLPVEDAVAQNFSGFLWRDLPGALDPASALSPAALEVQRLSTTGHWRVPIVLPGGGRLQILVWHATPPAFDGPEDRNGRRNHDEAAFWLRLLDGQLSYPPPVVPFVLMANANADPLDGDARADAIRALLAHPALQDPRPRGVHGRVEADHVGDAATDTVDFGRDRGLPGGLRVDYVLPSAGLEVVGAGVLWPSEGTALAATLATASRHRPVWVDLVLP